MTLTKLSRPQLHVNVETLENVVSNLETRYFGKFLADQHEILNIYIFKLIYLWTSLKMDDLDPYIKVKAALHWKATRTLSHATDIPCYIFSCEFIDLCICS